MRAKVWNNAPCGLAVNYRQLIVNKNKILRLCFRCSSATAPLPGIHFAFTAYLLHYHVADAFLFVCLFERTVVFQHYNSRIIVYNMRRSSSIGTTRGITIKMLCNGTAQNYVSHDESLVIKGA